MVSRTKVKHHGKVRLLIFVDDVSIYLVILSLAICFTFGLVERKQRLGPSSVKLLFWKVNTAFELRLNSLYLRIVFGSVLL